MWQLVKVKHNRKQESSTTERPEQAVVVWVGSETVFLFLLFTVTSANGLGDKAEKVDNAPTSVGIVAGACVAALVSMIIAIILVTIFWRRYVLFSYFLHQRLSVLCLLLQNIGFAKLWGMLLSYMDFGPPTPNTRNSTFVFPNVEFSVLLVLWSFFSKCSAKMHAHLPWEKLVIALLGIVRSFVNGASGYGVIFLLVCLLNYFETYSVCSECTQRTLAHHNFEVGEILPKWSKGLSSGNYFRYIIVSLNLRRRSYMRYFSKTKFSFC